MLEGAAARPCGTVQADNLGSGSFRRRFAVRGLPGLLAFVPAPKHQSSEGADEKQGKDKINRFHDRIPNCQEHAAVHAKPIDLNQSAAFSQIVVRQSSDRGTLEIVELTVAQRPDKCTEPGKPKAKRDRQKKNDDVHDAAASCSGCVVCRLTDCAAPLRRTAFSVTSTDEPDIAAAAINGVTRPATASGTAIRL